MEIIKNNFVNTESKLLLFVSAPCKKQQDCELKAALSEIQYENKKMPPPKITKVLKTVVFEKNLFY